MSDTTISVEDAAACLPDLVERVHAGRLPIVIVKAGLPMVRIVPIPVSNDGLIAFLRRWRSEHPELDNEFAEAIEESRTVIKPPRDAWE